MTVQRFEPEEFRETAQVTGEWIYDEASTDELGFWARQAQELHWDTPFTTVLDDSNPPFYKWFTDGRLNVSYNCLDRHVEAGRGEKVAYHWVGEEGETRDITYAQLLAEVQRFANGLKALGVGKGDVVGIFLPMVPEVVVAMLACARIGAVHNVVFGGFSPASVRERMEVSTAKALVTADEARRKGRTAAVKASVDAAMGDLESLRHIVVVRVTGAQVPMMEGRDVFYDDVIKSADPVCVAEPMEAENPLFILYSSGSTAKPKGVLHTTGGYLTGVSYTHRLVFDLDPERDVYFCTADVGWITGHSYIVYGPLANATTSVMYEGAPDYPHKGIWWELIARYGVTIFYTAPTAIRACMAWGEEWPAKYNLSSLRLLGTVGEPINPKAWLWYHTVIGGERCPIVDTWWQTETGSIMIAPLPGVVATKPGRRPARCPASLRLCSTRTATNYSTVRGCSCSPSRGRRCFAGCTATPSATCRPISPSSVHRFTSSATPPSSTVMGISGSSGERTTSSTSRPPARPRKSNRRSSRTRRSPRRPWHQSRRASPVRPSSRSSPWPAAGDAATEAEIRDHVASASAGSPGPSGSSGPATSKTSSGKIMRRLSATSQRAGSSAT